MRWFLLLGVIGAALATSAGLIVTRPDRSDVDFTGTSEADPAAGALVFAAAGCASCHAAPNAEGDARLILSGGRAFASDFGTFFAPNISPDPTAGIGGWSRQEFTDAVTRGVSPAGQHYYPAFPYTAYAKMTPQDLVDLFSYMQSLPASDVANRPHDVGLPFSIRRGVGVWKALYFDTGYEVTGPLTPAETRGRYLAEGLAHCAECHTPRTALGGLDRSRWLGGAPNPSGKGRIPNITPSALAWSEEDMIAYFTSGLTPDYDSAGGEMVEVIENLAQLPEADRAALASYLKKVAPVP
ncbi:cytochrome c [Roseobacter sp. YSTF-M11]|uniref:Cytochrome c n=1 Tax=Roseobacter insulae TaxID=2859783 RepID=A0A9X1FWZ0_9RHOB|nr:cytochrome c [Roseobacter insulae]MBW4708812.1 cytochrome c [Roseobacter insulae]